jgi:hypothetical protein
VKGGLPKMKKMKSRSHRHSDPLVKFSHRIVQVKFIIVETASLLGFLALIYAVVRHELGL